MAISGSFFYLNSLVDIFRNIDLTYQQQLVNNFLSFDIIYLSHFLRIERTATLFQKKKQIVH